MTQKISQRKMGAFRLKQQYTVNYLLCIVIAAWLLNGCGSSLVHSSQAYQYEGSISGYEFNEHVLTLQAGNILTAEISASELDVIVFSPISAPLEQGESLQVNEAGEYTIRVLLPRALARREVNVTYQLLLNVQP